MKGRVHRRTTILASFVKQTLGPIGALQLAWLHAADEKQPHTLFISVEDLYPLDADPCAVKNLINDSTHAEPRAELRKQFNQWRAFTRDNAEPFAMRSGKVAE